MQENSYKTPAVEKKIIFTFLKIFYAMYIATTQCVPALKTFT